LRLAYPVIVLPGILGSTLRDEYLVPPETVWAALTKEFERIALHPDDLRYETIEPARIVPDSVVEVAYRELLEELRYNLREEQDESVPVFGFSYDWRQSIASNAGRLAALADEVIERTKLLRHYQKESGKPDAWIDDPKVNLVGHSMGGLVITAYLAHARARARVAKVVTLATPFRGSFEAVVKLATGTANLGGSAPSSREREAARMTPAVYHLLPSCDGLLLEGAPTGKSLFTPELWQRSIVESLQEYVRLYAADPKGAKAQAEKLFAAMLAEAKAHREVVDKFRLSDAGLSERDWLCVAGVNAETRVALNIVRPGNPQFEFRGEDRDNQWNSADSVRSGRTGDGTVPFEAAVPSFLSREGIVCVTPDDYGYWEIQDRLVTGIAGFHGILPNMDMLHRLIVRFFTGRADRRRNTWGRRAPGVAAGQWQPPLELEEELED
jgi:pimeloyl-ACP methyl ester carboxylesterase